MRLKLVVIGDSFVEGRGDPAPGGGYHGWIPTFQRLLGISVGESHNCGEHLATTSTVLDRQLDAVRLARPQLAGVIAGFNDIVGRYRPEEFRENLREIFAGLTRHATVAFTATYLDISDRMALTAAARAEIRTRTTDANRAIRGVSAEFDMVCLDTARSPWKREWDGNALWSDDGIHPNHQGYLRFAEHLAGAVADSMGILLNGAAEDVRVPTQG